MKKYFKSQKHLIDLALITAIEAEKKAKQKYEHYKDNKDMINAIKNSEARIQEWSEYLDSH